MQSEIKEHSLHWDWLKTRLYLIAVPKEVA
jgi:hypothetical protein